MSSGSSSASCTVQDLFQKWVNPMQAPVQSRLPSLEDLTCGNTAGIRPKAITRAQLMIARPLQQVSRRFVPLVCGPTLAIMDQHAAAECVRLEELQQEVIGEQGHPLHAECMKLRPPQQLDLSPAELQALQQHQAQVRAWGWGFADEDLSCSGPPVLTHVAAVLGTPLNATELQGYLHQLERTSGVARVPEGAHRLLASKACHSAIRFGDVLSAEQCGQLVKALQKTQLWHCCAHGRPTITPLVDLASLQSVLQMRRTP